MRRSTILALVPLLFFLAGPAHGQEIRKEEVKFKAGEISAAVKGQIKAEQIVDYIVGARAGQKMTVTLKSSNASCYFNVTAPGQDAALFVGSTSGSTYEGVLPANGNYTVRLYLMRNAARRGETANYTITFSVDGGTKASGAATQTSGPPATYDATGKVKSSLDKPTLDGWSDFWVVRGLANKGADIWIARPATEGGASYRMLKFVDGKFTTTDHTTVTSKRDADNWLVSVGGREFFLIPDALIHGG